MVDGITGLTSLYLAEHLFFYSIKNSTEALSVFHLVYRTHYSALCFFSMQPSHYLQLAAATLICDGVPFLLCAAAVPGILELKVHQ